jgi:hypothetical protein
VDAETRKEATRVLMGEEEEEEEGEREREESTTGIGPPPCVFTWAA